MVPAKLAELQQWLLAFVPSLDLVVTRQTGGSGAWPFEEYLRRACAAVSPAPGAAQ
jgi:hypothetical protein